MEVDKVEKQRAPLRTNNIALSEMLQDEAWRGMEMSMEVRIDRTATPTQAPIESG